MRSIFSLIGLPSARTLGIALCHLARGDNNEFSSKLVFQKQRGFIVTKTKLQTEEHGSDNIRNISGILFSTRSKKQSGEGDDNMLNVLPFYICGEIVRGFGRGSKELGIPTANFSLEVVKSLPTALVKGIYYGWANVDNGEVYKMVISVGTNPYYDNKEKSMETHIIHKFDGDLYGHLLKVCIVGFLRPERDFDSLQELVTAIHSDIEQAKTILDSDEESRRLRYSQYFNVSHVDNDTAPSKKQCTNGDALNNGS